MQNSCNLLVIMRKKKKPVRYYMGGSIEAADITNCIIESNPTKRAILLDVIYKPFIIIYCVYLCFKTIDYLLHDK